METLVVYKSPYPKTRIGKHGDGGYVVCDIPTKYDILLSGGVGDDISFETDFLSRNPDCHCFAFDGTVASLPTNEARITFVRKNLGLYETPTMTNLVEFFETHDNIFFKLDIEGHEFRLLPVLLERFFHKVKQFVIEIHSPGDIQLHPAYFKGLGDVTNDVMFSILRDINKTHTLVHIHGNNGCQQYTVDNIVLPNVFECTYIRNDFVTEKIANDIPFPIDLDCPNVSSTPQYVLKGFPYSRNRTL